MDIRQRIAIFDIDGTVANSYHRLHHIVEPEKHDGSWKKDWDTFDSLAHLDTPIHGMLELCECLQKREDLDVMFLTGRSDRTRAATYEWLTHWGIQPRNPDLLQMRKEKDWRHADIIKLERLQNMGIDHRRVITIFDDDTRVIKMLRAHNYHACHVAEDRYSLAQEGGR